MPGWIWMLLLSRRNYCFYKCTTSFTAFALAGISKTYFSIKIID